MKNDCCNKEGIMKFNGKTYAAKEINDAIKAAGGLILVLNKENVKDPIDDYTGVGMYGGKILVRAHLLDTLLPKQIKCKKVEGQELAEFTPYIKEYAEEFGAEFAAHFDRSRLRSPGHQRPFVG